MLSVSRMFFSLLGGFLGSYMRLELLVPDGLRNSDRIRVSSLTRELATHLEPVTQTST